MVSIISGTFQIKSIHSNRPHRFRSRAFVDFGSPITITREQVDKYRKGGKEKREVIGELMNTVYHALKSVTVTAPGTRKMSSCDS